MPYNSGYGDGGSSRSVGGLRRRRSRSPDDNHQQYYNHEQPQHRSHNGADGSSGFYDNPSHSRQQHSERRHSPPRRSSYRRRHDDMPYTIPDVAPRLHVPYNLPVDITSLLDLVAFYVVQGGPTTEEEIMRREENNQHFAFFHAHWKDPMQLYYRWRLFSLLQGDTLLKWRTEPYQIERGNEAYVWVPPPAIPSGPECLLDAFKGSRQLLSGGRNNDNCCGDRENASQAPWPVPSALWLSRMSVSEGFFFVSLESSAVAEWQRLLRMDQSVAEITATVGPLLEDRIAALTAVLLDNDLIARRMVFAVENQRAALHLMSFALDEVVRLAYQAASSLRHTRNESKDGFGSTVVAADSGNDKGRNSNGGNGDGICGGSFSGDGACKKNINNVGDNYSASASNELLNAAARCCMCLSYLFTLNEIGVNGSAVPLSAEEVAGIGQSLEKAGSDSNANCFGGVESTYAAPSSNSSTLPLPQSTSLPSASSARLLNRALEKIMPTLIEATLIVGLCTVQQYGSLIVENARETAKSSAKPPGAEEFEGILPLDIDQAAYVHVRAKLAPARAAVSTSTLTFGTGAKKEDRDAVCMIAMLLISWLKELCSLWAENDVIGSRCWSTLMTKYVYFLSQPIEST